MGEKISLFRNISKDEHERMMICFKVIEKSYKSEEIICQHWNSTKTIGYIRDGEVTLIKSHPDGRQTIIEYLQKGDVFGAPLSAISYEGGGLYVACKKDCIVQWIDYEHLIKRCPNACPFHSQLVDNAIEILSNKAVSLSTHLEILSQRTTRDKLLCYFEHQCIKNNTKEFEIPFSYGSLADYLSVDRSAMMREIKKLKTDNVIATDKNKIILNY